MIKTLSVEKFLTQRNAENFVTLIYVPQCKLKDNNDLFSIQSLILCGPRDGIRRIETYSIKYSILKSDIF